MFISARNRSAAGRLNGDHFWPLAGHPAQLLHLFKGFPHADDAHAAARGIKDGIGILPAQLLHQLVSHGLLAFHAERFLERGDIEPSFGLLALGDDAAAVGDEPVDEREMRAVNLALHLVGERHIFGHEDVGLNSGCRSIGRQRSAGIACRWRSQLLDSIMPRHGHGQCQATRLECACWDWRPLP